LMVVWVLPEKITVSMRVMSCSYVGFKSHAIYSHAAHSA
jgi:hypothetical protein